MIKIALVGAGAHALHFHAPSLSHYAAKHPGQVELAAVCDLDAAKAEVFRDKFGLGRAYSNIDEMLDAEHPDGVACIVKGQAVLETGVHMLERGVACVIEKPPGLSIESARRLAAVAERTGTPNLVSDNRRFMPLLNEALTWAREQGPIRYVRVTMLRHNRRESPFIWGAGLHPFDTMMHIAGEMEAHTIRSFHAEELSTHWFEVTLQFEGGCAGVLHIFPTCGATEETYEIFGEGYRVWFSVTKDFQTSMSCFRAGKSIITKQSPPDEPSFVSNGTYHETAAFLQALLDKSLPGPTIQEVLPSLELSHRIEEHALAAK